MKTEFKFNKGIPSILERADWEYKQAGILTKDRTISIGLGEYLKEMANMMGCLRIAELFAGEADIYNTSLRLSEAASVCKGIVRAYSHLPSDEVRRELVELARNEFVKAYKNCNQLLRERN